jgi:hypothetical protein
MGVTAAELAAIVTELGALRDDLKPSASTARQT